MKYDFLLYLHCVYLTELFRRIETAELPQKKIILSGGQTTERSQNLLPAQCLLDGTP